MIGEIEVVRARYSVLTHTRNCQLPPKSYSRKEYHPHGPPWQEGENTGDQKRPEEQPRDGLFMPHNIALAHKVYGFPRRKEGQRHEQVDPGKTALIDLPDEDGCRGGQDHEGEEKLSHRLMDRIPFGTGKHRNPKDQRREGHKDVDLNGETGLREVFSVHRLKPASRPRAMKAER